MKYEILGSKDARRTTLPPTFRVGPLAFETISLTQGGSVYRICCLIRVEHDGKGNVSRACQYTSQPWDADQSKLAISLGSNCTG